MDLEKLLNQADGFDWDLWNEVKNIIKHQVDNRECEDVFFNQPRLVSFDEKHSIVEDRYRILGVTDGDRRLVIVFTMINNKIRIISARDQNKKERLQFIKLKNG